LDKTWQVLTEQGWSAPTGSEPKGRVRVDVFDTPAVFDASGGPEIDAPFTYRDENGPFIALRSVINEPDQQAMLARAAIEAAHEGTHLFTQELRRTKQRMSNEYGLQVALAWHWFDEATAVFVERLVFPEHRENLRFAVHWAHRPELELEASEWPGGYCAAWFIEYLERAFPGLLRDVWRDSVPAQTPVSTLDRLLRLPPHNTNFAEVFAEHPPGNLFIGAPVKGRPCSCQVARCRDNYSIQAYFSACFAPLVHRRFGGRSIAESLVIPEGGSVQRGEEPPLAPLSCRYYHLYAARPAGVVRARLEVEAPLHRCHLRAALLPVAGLFPTGPRPSLPSLRGRGRRTRPSFPGRLTRPVPRVGFCSSSRMCTLFPPLAISQTSPPSSTILFKHNARTAAPVRP
jgi:hypothetical protein